MLIFYKQVDKSALNEGVAIPEVYQKLLTEKLGIALSYGESRNIKVEMEGILYDAVLRNQKYDKNKYKNHADVVQIRYSSGSRLAQMIREKFSYTEEKINIQKLETGKTRVENWPEEEKEFIAVYSTDVQNVLSFECIPNGEFREETAALAAHGELAAENMLEGTDPDASIVMRTKVTKIRKLSRSIGDELKKYYGYRCQICGKYIGEKYGSKLIHAHHIDYFVSSLNNDVSNIMIVCPNHHGIIHDRNPKFNKYKLSFLYPNGYEERLKLNNHL